MLSTDIILRLFVVASVFSNVNGARILGLFPHTGRSHQMVFEPLLYNLASRGHEVTVVSFFPIKNPPKNYTDVSLEGFGAIGLETVDIQSTEMDLPNLYGFENVMKQLLMFHPLAEKAINVCSKVVKMDNLKDVMLRNYDVILVETFNSDCMLGLLEAFGQNAPKIGLSSCDYPHWAAERLGLSSNPSYVTLLSSSFTSKINFWERLENSLVKIAFKYWFRNYIQVKEQEIIEKHLGRKIKDLQDIALNTTMIIGNVFHSFNGVKPTVPGLVEAGGMHLSTVKKPIPKYIAKFIEESTSNVVLFSLGSLLKTSTMPKDKEEIFLKVFSRFPQRFIWKFEDCNPEGNLTGNVLKVGWIPQYELLQHNKVIAFIGHGGLLGMTEVISTGKPMLAIPFFGDQFHNAALANEAGFARVIMFFEMTEESLYEALSDVLSPEKRERAAEISTIWHDRPMKPLDTATYWVERVARYGYKDPLHNPGRDLPFYKRYLLDVAAALLLFTLSVIILVYIVLKSFLFILQRLIFSDQAKKEKKH